MYGFLAGFSSPESIFAEINYLYEDCGFWLLNSLSVKKYEHT